MLRPILMLAMLATPCAFGDTTVSTDSGTVTTTTTTTAPGAAPVPATTTTTTNDQQQPAVEAPAMVAVPGGYNKIEVTDQGVQDAAKFAVEQMQQGNLVKVDSAQMQVVAGKNYALDLILAQNGVNYKYKVVVFVPLPNSGQEMQLTNIQAAGRVP